MDKSPESEAFSIFLYLSPALGQLQAPQREEVQQQRPRPRSARSAGRGDLQVAAAPLRELRLQHAPDLEALGPWGSDGLGMIGYVFVQYQCRYQTSW